MTRPKIPERACDVGYVRQTQPCVCLTVREIGLEDVFLDMVRVHISHRPGVSAGRILTVECNGVFVPLVARGAHDNSRDEIWLDLETRGRLGGLKPNVAYNFKLHTATWSECMRWAWSATDPAYRIPAKISLISVALGVVGLFLGIVSLLN